ncbi:MAG: AraC family transcriptional regulator, partial [Clostridia bacterium]|nr:AraC family transcriptional regulator [Clostridia bacterium]
MNVNQTADYLGFSSVSYFSRSFKSVYGVSPAEYKA